jgi:hypothetical protein
MLFYLPTAHILSTGICIQVHWKVVNWSGTIYLRKCASKQLLIKRIYKVQSYVRVLERPDSRPVT